MGIGFRKGKMKMRFTGITPGRLSKPREMRTIEFNCVKCNVTIDHKEYVDEPPVNVIGCPNCGTVFNRTTEEILAEDGRFVKRLRPDGND